MTSGTDDFISFITPPPENWGYRQGTVVSWNPTAGTNQVNIGGTNFTNLPIITQADVQNIRLGDPVAVVRYNDSYAVLGKIKALSQGTLWTYVPLYPQFVSLVGAGTGGYAVVNAGTSVSWESRLYVTHQSFIQVDGLWGQASGSNTSVFEVIVDGITVGTWTEAGTFTVSNKGPYDISRFKDRQFIKVEVKVTSSGSGLVAIQVLACFLR